MQHFERKVRLHTDGLNEDVQVTNERLGQLELAHIDTNSKLGQLETTQIATKHQACFIGDFNCKNKHQPCCSIEAI
jgi:hypothetical protein